MSTNWDRVALGISFAITLMALAVLVGWHAHIRAVVQIFHGLIPMQYNTALCFLALGAAGMGLSTRRRWLLLSGGIVAALMGAAVILEYATGISFGIDTFFFYPWERTLSADPGRMALSTAISFLLTGNALVLLAVRQGAYAIFGIVNSVSLSLALTSLIGYTFQITYVLPFSLGSQMALHTAAAFFAYGIAMLGYAWMHAERGPDGLPKWSAGIGVALLPVLFVGASALFPRQSWQTVAFELLFAIVGVALITLGVLKLTTAKVAYKGLLMIAVPLFLLLTFVGLVAHMKERSESAQELALHSTEVLGVSQSVLARIAEAESASRGYVITGHEAFGSAYDASLQSVTQTTAQLRKLVSENRLQEASARRIELLTALRMANLSDMVWLIKSGNNQQAEEEIKGGAGRDLMNQVRAEIEVFSQEEARLGAARRQYLDTSWQRLSWLLVAGTAAAILLASILTLSFSGGITRRLQRLRDNAINLSAGKKLAPPLTGDDEIAELDRVFHAMAESLDEATRREKANQVLEGRIIDVRHTEALLKTGALQSAIFNSANFSSIATDAKGVIQIFNVGAERMLGYAAADVMNKITPADISDPQEVIARAKALSIELSTPITPGFEALVFKASRGIEDIYELTYIRKDGSRFPAVVSVTALRDAQNAIIGYLLIGTDNTARKQAEEALLKAGALQSAIFNSANFSSIATDAKGVIQIFNVGAERMLGYAAADVMNKITPADISDPQEVIARAKALSVELSTPITPGFEALVFKASRGIEDIYELTYIRKDGSRFPAVVSVTALRDAQSAIIGYLLIGTDNTARKLAEEALLKAGALQSAIFNSANFSSIATDAKGVIQIFNVGAERMLGYAAADVMNKITPADISDPQEVIARARALSLELRTTIAPGFEALVFKASRGIEDIYELTYIRKDGSRFPAVVSVTALREVHDHGGIIGYLLIGTDNTARKQVEAEQKKLDQRLRDQQFYTRSLIESNIDALVTTDPLGIITDVNKQMEALTDCTRDELIGAPFKNYFTDPERAEAGIKLMLSGKKVTDYELTACARDGKKTEVSYNATTFYDRDRKLQGVFAAARDVTERKRSERALQETNVELESAKSAAEKANLAKSDFLSTMSHELRTPLNAIIGFSSILADKTFGDLNDRQLKYSNNIFNSGRHLLQLINDILDLAKVEAGRVELMRNLFSVSKALSEVQTIVKTLANKKHITLEFEVASDLQSLFADEAKFKQVMYNLLSNAIKFTPDGGNVFVTAGIRYAGSAESSSVEGSLRVAVADTGIGIKAIDQERVFKEFEQVDSSYGRLQQGTGLGLALTRRLVEMHGGQIWLESEGVEGRGSTFTFSIPIPKDEANPTERQSLLTELKRLSALSDVPFETGANS